MHVSFCSALTLGAESSLTGRDRAQAPPAPGNGVDPHGSPLTRPSLPSKKHLPCFSRTQFQREATLYKGKKSRCFSYTFLCDRVHLFPLSHEGLGCLHPFFQMCTNSLFGIPKGILPAFGTVVKLFSHLNISLKSSRNARDFKQFTIHQKISL